MTRTKNVQIQRFNPTSRKYTAVKAASSVPHAFSLMLGLGREDKAVYRLFNTETGTASNRKDFR